MSGMRNPFVLAVLVSVLASSQIACASQAGSPGATRFAGAWDGAGVETRLGGRRMQQIAVSIPSPTGLAGAAVGAGAGAVGAGAGAVGAAVGAAAGAAGAAAGAGLGLMGLGSIVQTAAGRGGDIMSGTIPFVLRGGATIAGASVGVAGGITSIINPTTYLVMPVRQAPRRSDCVVYTPGYSETLSQVSSRLGVPINTLLGDNIGSISTANEALLGRVILVCGLPEGRQAAPAPAAAAPAAAAAPKVEPAPQKPVLQASGSLLKPAKTQEAALMSVRYAVDPKGVLSDWKTDVPYCNWAYVVCDSSGNVIRLTLSYLGLEGQPPPAAAIQDLPGLQGLLLGGNMLKGQLPGGYGASGLREIYLNDNQLSGPLPKEWSQSAALDEVSVAFNSLSGPLPADWARIPTLRVLKLNSNKFSGEVPRAWASMPALSTLTVFDNPDLSGCLPGGKSYQAPNGQQTSSAKEAAAGTKIGGVC